MGLASSYEVLNPILGFTPGSPSRAIGYHTSQTNESSSDNDDDCNMINSSEGGSYRQFHSWKKEAKRYDRDVLEGSRNPFNKFDKDPTLDRIRKDSRLEHLPQSKTNKCSSSSKKKERKESTRCALCVGLFGSSNAKKTVYFCPTC